MATPLTPAQYAAALLIRFPEKRIQAYGRGEQDFWMWLPKKTGFSGREDRFPVEYTPGGGTSHTFADAQEAKGGGDIVEFTVTRKKDYHLISIENETIEASRGDGGYMDAKELQVDNGFKKIVQRLGWDLQGDGTGLAAVVQSSPAVTATVFSVTPQQFSKFNIGDRLVFYTLGGVLRSGSVGYAIVTAKTPSPTAPTLTVGGAGDNLTTLGVAATDLVYFKGSRNNAVLGTAAWIPKIASRPVSATPFAGVNRSVSEGDLAGYAFDGSTYGLAEALERGTTFGAQVGCNFDTIWLNYTRFTDLSRELGASVVREQVKIGSFAMDSISINARGRKVRVMGDINFDDDDALGATRESWEFKTLGKAPRFLHTGEVPEATADGIELRLGWYGDLRCKQPSANMRFKLPV